MDARVWLVIPTYNEAMNVERIVRAVGAELDRLAPGEYRILIVDDTSPDGTGELADELARQLGTVDVLHRPEKTGLGHAYLAGFAYALDRGAQLILQMDADFSHDPRYLGDLLEAATNADLVLGSRYVDGGGVRDWGLARRMISRGGSLYARTILGVDVRDLTGGFKCIRREVLETIDLPSIRAEGYVFQIEVTYRSVVAGFRVEEVPIVFGDRTEGTSKMSARIALEAMWLVPRLRRTVPAALGSGGRQTAPADLGVGDDIRDRRE
ncbi:MAG TPA: polyprenol monophosphomannose synthase [Solirubrobacteraceae bacterium]|jgi:dolichol-phosphate mannosyltransferase